jgi:hypothetical protein
MHVMRENQLHAKNSYTMNASREPTSLKAKLFMSYDEHQKGHEFIHNGDCIRLKQCQIDPITNESSDGYLTCQSKDIDLLLPAMPDFLKGQIRRMYLDEKIERPKGGLDLNELYGNEKIYAENDKGFEGGLINDDYVNHLKSRAHEHVYLENDKEELRFTNSCWEIQRMNPLAGGNIVIDEVVKFKHVGTGKYLCLNSDSKLGLSSNSSNLSALFFIRSHKTQNKNNKYVDIDGDGVIDNYSNIETGQQIMIQSFLTEKYLQL